MDRYVIECPCGKGVLEFRVLGGFPLRARCPICRRMYVYSKDSAPEELRKQMLPSARRDGYVPVAAYLDTGWPRGATDLAADEYVLQNSLFVLAARRLDASHRLFEDGRQVIEAAGASYASEELIHEAMGDVELGIVALSRALKVCLEIRGRWEHPDHPFPEFVAAAVPKITLIRNSVEHADARAHGFVGHRKKGPEASSLSLNYMSLFLRDLVVGMLKAQFPDDPSAWHAVKNGEPLRREYIYAEQKLDIDDEITLLLSTTGSWLLSTWIALRSLGS